MKTKIISFLFIWLSLWLAVPAQAQEGIVVGSETVVVHPDETGMDVHTILQLVNTSAAAQEAAWALPAASSKVNILVGGDTVTLTGQRLKWKEKLAAGANVTIVYKYRYTFPKGASTLSLPFSYPAQSLQVLLPLENQDVTLTGPAIQKDGEMQFQGKSYISYTGQGIAAGLTTIQVDKPAAVPPFHSEALIQLWSSSVFRSVNPHVLTAIFVAVIVGGSYGLYRTVRTRRQEAQWRPDEEEQRFLDVYRQSQLVFAKLTELQEQREAGKLTDAEFTDKRSVYKERLVALKLQLHEFTAEGERT